MAEVNTQVQQDASQDQAHGHGHHDHDSHVTPDGVIMPAPTVWPAVLALGIMLVASGVVLDWLLTILGACLVLAGAMGWISAFAREESILEPLAPDVRAAAEIKPADAGIQDAPKPGLSRMYPEFVHPLSAGFKGGIVGGIVMGVIALLYGVISGHGLWYPINLLAAMVLPWYQGASPKLLDQFSLVSLVIGLMIHIIMAPCLGVFLGVLYSMLPRPRVIIAGIVGPLLWTGILYAFMTVLNPELAAHAHVGEVTAFVISQVAYGLIVAIVIERSELIPVVGYGHGHVHAQAAGNPEQANTGGTQ